MAIPEPHVFKQADGTIRAKTIMRAITYYRKAIFTNLPSLPHDKPDYRIFGRYIEVRALHHEC